MLATPKSLTRLISSVDLQPGGSRLSILLVEDEWLTLTALAVALEDAGFEVVVAEHAHEGFDHLDRFPGMFTCLITDFQMPGEVTGAHVVERMRPDYPFIPMILTTAMAHVIPSEWWTQNAALSVPKPYNLDLLVEKVSRLLAG